MKTENEQTRTNEFPIHGDGTINTSRGTAEVWVENGTVNITLPDRFGIPGAMVNLTFGDAETLAKELDHVLSAAHPRRSTTMKTENEELVESFRDWIEPIDISPDRDEIERAWVALRDARGAYTHYPEARHLTPEQKDAEVEAEDVAKARLVRVIRESEATWPQVQDFVRQTVALSEKVTSSQDAGVNRFIREQVTLTAALLFDLLEEGSTECIALGEATHAMRHREGTATA